MAMADNYLGKSCTNPKDWVAHYIKQKSFKYVEKYNDTIILFLDFDGVIHSWGSDFPMDKEPSDKNLWKSGIFSEFYRILEVLDLFPNVKIVFSTSWCNHYSFKSLQKMFDDKYHNRIIGNTNDCYDFNRGLCCKEWLKSHHFENIAWIALDDIALFDLDDPVVRTDMDKGLDNVTFDVLIQALSNPIEYAIYFKN